MKSLKKIETAKEEDLKRNFPEEPFYKFSKAKNWLAKNILPISLPGLIKLFANISGVKGKKELSAAEVDKIGVTITLRSLNFTVKEIKTFLNNLETIRKAQEKGAHVSSSLLQKIQEASETYKDIITRAENLKKNLNYVSNNFKVEPEMLGLRFHEGPNKSR